MKRYLNKISNTKNVLSWKSMGISDDEPKPLNNTTLVPQLLYPYYHSDMQACFKGSCFLTENNSISNKKALNIYIV